MRDAIRLLIDQIRDDNLHRVSINSLLSAQSVPIEVGQTLRGYVVASGLEEARSRLVSLLSRLENMSIDLTCFIDYLHRRNHTVVRLIRSSPDQSRPVFVYPGEGSQSRGMLRELSIYFPIVNTWMSEITYSLGIDLAIMETILSNCDSEQQLPASAYEINISTGLVFGANMSINQLLLGWGIRPVAHLGHSTGQNSSLFAGSWLSANSGETILQRACSHVSAMRNAWAGIDVSDDLDDGYLVYILQQPDIAKLNQVCNQHSGNIIVSMRNCPDQYVVAIPRDLREIVEPRLRESCILLLKMPIKRPYHTKHFQKPSSQMMQFYEGHLSFNEHSGEPVYSCTSGNLIQSALQARHELSSLMDSTVNFDAAVRTMIDHGYHVYLECGHGSTTANFIRSISKSYQHADVITTQNATNGGLESFLCSIGALWSYGNPINTLYIEEQARIESKIATGFIKGPKEVHLNLLMPRARLSDSYQAPNSAQAHEPFLAELGRSSQASTQVPRKRHQGVWTGQVTLRRDTPVLKHHTLPNRSAPSEGIRAEGVYVIPMALFTSLAISAAIKATGSNRISLNDLKMSRWVEASDLNEFSIQLIEESSKQFICQISHNSSKVFACAIRPEGLMPECELRAQHPLQTIKEKKPYFWSSNELYQHGMFHGPFYQVIKNIVHCETSEMEGILCTTTNSAELNTIQILDGIAQASAFWAAPSLGLAFHTFPLEINQLKVGVIKPSSTHYTFRITNTRHSSGLLGFDGVVLDEENVVVLEFKQFLHSLIRLPQAYHSCFADCEFAYFSTRLSTTPNEICISIVDNAQALESYLDPNGFFASIFRHMWFNESELKSLGELGGELSQFLMLLSRKECLRFLLDQLAEPIPARNVMVDQPGNVFYVDTREKRLQQLPTPVTLCHSEQFVSIVSFTHRVTLVHFSQPHLGQGDQQPSQAMDKSSDATLKCINGAIQDLLGIEINVASLKNVTVLDQASITARWEDQFIMAGAFRLGVVHYGWAAVRSMQ
jgi:malonyl CoA-acyl carrier protein transacylase